MLLFAKSTKWEQQDSCKCSVNARNTACNTQGDATADRREEAMIHVRKLLVPVDFSEPSKKAVNYGLSLALESEARLVLAHITPFDARAYEAAKFRLLELIPSELRTRLEFEIIVKAGDIRAELLAIVEEKEIDLVVMGTRGRSYFERLLLGSVTERLLRKVHVPILTVSHLDPEREIHEPGCVPFGRILYATDLANGSEAGLEFSLRLAGGLNAHLTVVHVVQAMDAAFQGIETAAYLQDDAAELRVQATERLNRLVSLVSDGSVPISTMIADGVPYETINRIAERNRSDLIVINLQGKGRLERALLGTTAERVIRTATVPVLSLPLPATYSSQWAALDGSSERSIYDYR
jgi:nucleotide-binding universal stress UspA family protein